MSQRLTALLCIAAAGNTAIHAASLRDTATIFDFFASQANATIKASKAYDQYPSNGACQSCYGWDYSDFGGWTAGFWPGILFQLFKYSTDHNDTIAAAWWYTNANLFSAALAKNQGNTGTHDVGFMTFPAFGQQYAYTGNATAKQILVNTANSLCKRFNAIVGCTESWGALNPPDHKFEVIIDNMMNLELLWWAARETGNATYSNIASSHSTKMVSDIFQTHNPGCVWHLIVYNDTNGNILSRTSTPQGLGNDTVWGRGQAWALDGFVIAYRYSRDPVYLTAAKAAADCFLRLLGATKRSDGIPPWDFNVTASNYAVDTSAAMIAASGLIELGQWTGDATYTNAAVTMLGSAVGPYLETAASSIGVLRNGTVTYPQFGIPIIYGDYYLLEALLKWNALPVTVRSAALDATGVE